MIGLARRGAGLALALSALAVLAAPKSQPSAGGDAKNGEALYGRCVACHALAYDRTGPRHCGLIGRTAGTVEGFPYSDAMRRSRRVWTPKTLDQFLASPLQAMPGTSMGYAGVPDPKERRDLIAYLRAANGSEECSKMR